MVDGYLVQKCGRTVERDGGLLFDIQQRLKKKGSLGVLQIRWVARSVKINATPQTQDCRELGLYEHEN